MKEQHRAGLRGAQTPFLEPEPHTPSAALKAKRMTRAALLPLLVLSLAACDLFGGDPPPPDPDRPSVITVSPADGTQDVALDTAVVATLNLPNGPIDESSVGNSTVTLTQQGEAVAVSATPEVSGSTITLTPAAPLELETTYTFSIDASVKDESGETLASAFSSTFTTGDDETDTNPLPEANLEASVERLIFETQNGQTSEAQTLTISNIGDAAFTLNSLEPTDSQFVLSGTPTYPATIDAGQSLGVQVAFKPTSLGPQEATLTVNGDSSLSTDLRGLSVKGDGGSDEPSLQWIFDTFDLGINTGDPDPSTTSIVNFEDFDSDGEARRETLNGTLSDSERIIQRFQKAGTGEVTVEVLAAYGLDSDPVTEFGWYPVGNPDSESRKEVFRIATKTGNAQTLNPDTVGNLSFDPGDSSFGFYSIWPGFNDREIYTQDALNDFGGAIPHHVRAYPLPNESNAYILATEEFTQGFDYNDVVVIVRNVKPAGPEGLSCNQNEPVISDRVLSKSYNGFELQNLSGAPFADRLVFSRIGNISGNFNDRIEPFTDLKCHDLNVLRLKNESGSALNVSNVRITGSSSGVFILSEGGPGSIAAGQTKELVVQFTEDSGKRGIREATLEMQVGSETVSVELAGIYQESPEGGREEYLGGVVRAFGYSTDVGTNTRGEIESAEPPGDPNFQRAGDEVISRFWKRADMSEPVYIRQLAAFHSCCSSSSNDSLELRVNGSTEGEFIHAEVYGQSVLPPVQGSNTEAAEMTVTPSGDFELVVRNGYSTDWIGGSRNNDNLGVRLWPVERNGSTEGFENTYIVAQDFVDRGCGTTDTANCDFNDNMYLITNVSPVSPE